MTFDEYQKQAAEFAVYPKDREREYLALGLISEVGELAGKLKKEIRDGGDLTAAMLDELGDCAWYGSQLANAAEVDLGAVMNAYREPNEAEGMTRDLSRLYDAANRIFLDAAFGRPVAWPDVIRAWRAIEAIAMCLSTTLEAVCEANIAKLADRKERGKLQGSGDNR